MKTNLIIIITHDAGRELGCYGRGVKTPNLDSFASEGILFKHAFCTAPQCCPSRASLLTGRVPHSHGLIGLVHRGFSFRPDVPKLPELLVKAGYRTHLFGLQHEAKNPLDLGYQKIHEARDRSCMNVGPLVTHFLASKPQEPFLAMVGFYEAHRRFPDFEGPVDTIKVPSFLPNAPEIRRDVASLHASIGQADEAVGQILNALRKSNLEKRTLVVYTTDHGIPFPQAKSTLFDPGLEISFLARGPAEWSGRKSMDAMVWNADFLPTVLEYLELPIPENVQGKSWLPLLRGETKSVHEAIFPELTFHSGYDPMRSVRTDQWKYIRSYEDRPYSSPFNVDSSPSKEWYRNNTDYYRRTRPRDLLFNLKSDPFEETNLAEDRRYQDVLLSLQERLDHWLDKTDDFMVSGQVPVPENAQITPPDSWGTQG